VSQFHCAWNTNILYLLSVVGKRCQILQPDFKKQVDGRDRILDVAGYFRSEATAVAMRDIAEAAGMRTASLYYHFPSKEELFVSVREGMFERHRIGLQDALEQVVKSCDHSS